MSSDRTQELAKIEALIEQAEDELEALRLRYKRNRGPPPDRSDPFDRVACLEIWLAALRDRRAELVGPLH